MAHRCGVAPNARQDLEMGEALHLVPRGAENERLTNKRLAWLAMPMNQKRLPKALVKPVEAGALLGMCVIGTQQAQQNLLVTPMPTARRGNTLQKSTQLLVDAFDGKSHFAISLQRLNR